MFDVLKRRTVCTPEVCGSRLRMSADTASALIFDASIDWHLWSKITALLIINPKVTRISVGKEEIEVELRETMIAF
jgi:hypothetical protein